MQFIDYGFGEVIKKL